MSKADAETRLIEAALAMADSLDWDITDNGHAVVRCGYDVAELLSDAAEEYRNEGGVEASEDYRRQKATRGLAGLMRRVR